MNLKERALQIHEFKSGEDRPAGYSPSKGLSVGLALVAGLEVGWCVHRCKEER